MPGFVSLIIFAVLGVIYPLALIPFLSQQLTQALQFSTLAIWFSELSLTISPLLPLEILPLTPYLALYLADWRYVFVFFILGLSLIFGYLLFEIMDALKAA